MSKSVIDMIKERENPKALAAPSSELDEFLEGFEVVPSDSIPSITLDNQRRFYINTSARRLLGVNPYDRLIVMYRTEIKALAIVKSDAISAAGDYATSNFNVDRRYYMSARYFSKTYGFPPEEAPYTFVYDRGLRTGKAFMFRLQE